MLPNKGELGDHDGETVKTIGDNEELGLKERLIG